MGERALRCDDLGLEVRQQALKTTQGAAIVMLLVACPPSSWAAFGELDDSTVASHGDVANGAGHDAECERLDSRLDALRSNTHLPQRVIL